MINPKKLLLVVGLLIILSTNQADAQENIPKGLIEEEENVEKGSIQIIIPDEKENIKKEEVKFQCIKVADWINGEYRLVESYQNLNVEVNRISSSNELDEAARIFADVETSCETKMADSNGELLFAGLESGLYLIKAKDTADYSKIMPVLIAVPTWSEVKEEMEYDVTAIPKHELVDTGREAVQTGDLIELSNYMIITGISCVVMVCLAARKRKRQNE